MHVPYRVDSVCPSNVPLPLGPFIRAMSTATIQPSLDPTPDVTPASQVVPLTEGLEKAGTASPEEVDTRAWYSPSKAGLTGRCPAALAGHDQAVWSMGHRLLGYVPSRICCRGHDSHQVQSFPFPCCQIAYGQRNTDVSSILYACQ